MEIIKKHNSMKSVVETFVIEETAELIYDNDKLAEWNRLVNEMGLTGQVNVVQKEKSPVPFLYMNDDLKRIAETLCPLKVDIEHYNAAPIPVEILGLVSLSKKEGYFDKIQIWSDERSPDPFCVGLRFRDDADRASNYTWRMNHHLIGKWGDVKRSWDELREMAIARFVKEKSIEMNSKIAQAKRYLEDLNNNPESLFRQNSFIL